MEATIETLCSVIDGWRDPTSPWRRRLEAALPEATGFSKNIVREGLARGLDHWSGEDLRSVLLSELAAAAGSSKRSRVTGFELTGVVLAGSIPMPSLLTLLLPLALHSPVLAKTAARDRVTAPLLAQSIGEVDADLARCIEVTSFSREDEACTRVFLDVDCVVASGSDETLARIREQLRSSRRLVAYGHRLSVALIGPETLSGTALADSARALALDTALWDQQGCLSPLAVFVEDPVGTATEAVALALADALSAAEKEWPRGAIERESAAAIVHQRDEAELRSAAGRPVRVLASDGTRWTVVLEDDATWRPAPLHRFLRVHPVSGRSALIAALSPVARHLSAAAITGFGDSSAEVTRELGRLGASRVCAPGAMQSPPIGWHRDGQPLLLPLARISDNEIPKAEPG